jgi:hypothetical protein
MSEAMAETLKRVQNGHPRQCQAIRPGMGTQCNFEAVEGGLTCIMHGGVHRLESNRVKSLNTYRLGKYQKRMQEFADSPRLRSIDEEIGILRMVLEEIFNQCSSDVDLLLYSQKISELIRDITKCVQVADRLATKEGMLIGRAEALTIATRVINVISAHIHDEQKLLEIAEQISDAFLTKIEPVSDTLSLSNQPEPA